MWLQAFNLFNNFTFHKAVLKGEKVSHVARHNKSQLTVIKRLEQVFNVRDSLLPASAAL
jgi:hypothetical protein